MVARAALIGSTTSSFQLPPSHDVSSHTEVPCTRILQCAWEHRVVLDGSLHRSFVEVAQHEQSLFDDHGDGCAIGGVGWRRVHLEERIRS